MHHDTGTSAHYIHHLSDTQDSDHEKPVVFVHGQPNSYSSCTDHRAEQPPMTTVPLSPSEPSHSAPFPDPTKRRPLPTPPSTHHHLPSLSQFDCVPSSPPPPYSSALPDDEPITMSRDLSRLAPAASSTTPAPEEPVIMAPPPDEQSPHNRAPYDSFLCHSTPANTWIAVETSQFEYTLLLRLPGFTRDGITIATKRRRILHVVADSWEPEGGHFERRVSFGYDAELSQVRAEFDGEMLRIVVPRRVSATIFS